MSTIDFAIRAAPLSSDLLSRLSGLCQAVFGEVDIDDLAWRLSHLPEATVAMATTDGGTMVGFKIGYAQTRQRYYSWLGGVHPDFRRRGIAAGLMEQQHRWAAAAGFTEVETGTTPDNAAMLQLNQRFGFEMIGSYARKGRPRVLLAKQLAG